jgi:hypothetical protein
MVERAVLRVRGARVLFAGYGLAFGLGFGAMAIFGPRGTASGVSDRVAILLIGIVGCALLTRCSRLRVEVDDDGVAVFQVFRTNRIPWGEIEELTTRSDVPYLVLRGGRRVRLGMLGPGPIRFGPLERARLGRVEYLRSALAQHIAR